MPSRKLDANNSIKVKPGDSVSQIAADLFDLAPANTRHLWNNFKRPVTNSYGHVTGYKDLANVNLIYPGEILYYHDAASQQVHFPETIIAGTPWVQARFRLRLDYTKVSIKIAEGTLFHGRLFAKFSDDADGVYAWNSFSTVAIGTTISFKFDVVDTGSILTKWSTPLEFNLSQFDPRVYWQKVAPVMSFSLGDLKVKSVVALNIKHAFPANNNFIRKNGRMGGKPSHISKPLELSGKISASQLPSVSSSFAVSLNLKGFRKLSKAQPANEPQKNKNPKSEKSRSRQNNGKTKSGRPRRKAVAR